MKSFSSKTITLEEGETIVGVRCRKDEVKYQVSALANFQFVVFKREKQ